MARDQRAKIKGWEDYGTILCLYANEHEKLYQVEFDNDSQVTKKYHDFLYRHEFIRV